MNTDPQITETPEIVIGHTYGTIGRYAPLSVQFAEEIAADDGALLRISPDVAGEVSVTGNRLTFTPNDGWTPGTTYDVTLALDRLRPDLADYSFPLEVMPLRLRVRSQGIFFPDPDDATTVALRGSIVTSDRVSAEELRDLLTAAQDGSPLEVTVQETDDPRRYTFQTANARRTQQGGEIVVSVQSRQAGFANEHPPLREQLAAAGVFRLRDARVAEADAGTVVLEFSEPVDRQQELRGQIYFSGDVPFTSRVEGNLIRLYPEGGALGTEELIVEPTIRSSAGNRLAARGKFELQLGRREPALRTVGQGVIMPYQGARYFTFEAIGVTNVRLELFKIYTNNVGHFLGQQPLDNSMADDWSLRTLGQVVARDKIALNELDPEGTSGRWTRYAIDLGQYVQGDAGAIYQVRLGFGMEDAVNDCGSQPEDFGLAAIDEQSETPHHIGFPASSSFMDDYRGVYGDYDDFDWDDRDDPCKPAYYNRDRFISRNVLSTNLGLIAKRNPDRSTVIFATDLLTARPRAGVEVTVLSAQQQELARGTTDNDGRLRVETEAPPALIRAEDGTDVAYLQVATESALNLSNFDISGTTAAGGVKGAFYTERGVWRPGDSIFLHFVLEDRQDRLPPDYPIEVTLRDAQNRVVLDRVVRPALGSQLYPIYLRTDAEDVTGRWRIEVAAGGQTFSRDLLVETVKPNRLAISLDRAGADRLTLAANWLYGAPGSGLAARVAYGTAPRTPDFPAWTGYTFRDPAREGNLTGEELLFDGVLNEAGRADFALPESTAPASGPLRIALATKVFEPGGNFSVDNQQLPYDPYDHYAAVNVPEGEWGGKVVSLEGATAVPVGVVSTTGKGVAGRRLTAGLYRVDWRYWWQDNYDNVSRFAGNSHTQAIDTYEAFTGPDGRATLRVAVSDWGRYLLRVCDEGGHCTGEFFYGGYGGGDDDREGAAVLRLSSDREEVAVGEEAVVSVPSSAGGRILVSLETGAGTLRQYWVDAEDERTEIRIPTTADMVPTVYANLTLLQPYAQTTNDRPVRLYGVQPISVVDPTTRLQPVVGAADEWAPNQQAEIMVAEKNGRPMTYTVAVVDEGLLGLTRFTTPDLHDAFFGKEALSVQTYDLYRFVLSSLGGVFGQPLAIGGGGLEAAAPAAKANRFEPVVRHLGPFRLSPNEQRTHRVDLPNYVGAVRVMVVGSGERAYGHVGTRVPVRQPLMVLPTLPRVLGPGETVDMPINVFVMDDKVRSAAVDVRETSGLVSTPAGRQSVTFTAPGDKLTYVPLRVGEKTGIARFEVGASGGGHSASQEIEIDVRQHNAVEMRTEDYLLSGGEQRAINYAPFGVPGSQQATLELSKLPPLQLSRHLTYLLRYPYGCAEQTISPAFAQLVLDRITELSAGQQELRQRNVRGGIGRLRQFQVADGGMAYWPGQRTANPWASSYALHFLTEAERAGFAVPYGLRSALIDHQRAAANRWRESVGDHYATADQLRRDQAYRLFTLALAEQADLGAMNRLRSRAGELPVGARFQLAAAYALAGRQQVATELISGQSRQVAAYRELGYTFGSQLRDMAMVLESLIAAGATTEAADQARALAREINQQGWLSTQEAAMSFVALAKIMEEDTDNLRAEVRIDGQTATTVGGNTGIITVVLPTTTATHSVAVNNLGSGTLYATVVRRGRPPAGTEEAAGSRLGLDVTYTDLEGDPIDVGQLASGTDFVANYTVRNPGTRGDYRQLALQTVLPSGWEVSNQRLTATADGQGDAFDYQDIRDDRVFTFFDLAAGQDKTFAFRLTATYPGRYYLPAQLAEAMYDREIRNLRPGQWVEVSRQ